MDFYTMISAAHVIWYMPTLLALLILEHNGLIKVSAVLMLIGGTALHGQKLFKAKEWNVLIASLVVFAIVLGVWYYKE